MTGLATAARPVVRGGVDAPPYPGLYRAVWRWHFYAGLLVIPFMLLLAVPGGISLFHAEIDGVLHGPLLPGPGRAAPPLAPPARVDAAVAARPGTPARFVPPASPALSA